MSKDVEKTTYGDWSPETIAPKAIGESATFITFVEEPETVGQI